MYADAEADLLVAIIRDAKMAVSSVVANSSKRGRAPPSRLPRFDQSGLN